MRTWLREIREQKKLLQVDVAKKAGLSQQAYNMIERDLRRPSPEVAQRIASVLSFDWTLFY